MQPAIVWSILFFMTMQRSASHPCLLNPPFLQTPTTATLNAPGGNAATREAVSSSTNDDEAALLPPPPSLLTSLPFDPSDVIPPSHSRILALASLSLVQASGFRCLERTLPRASEPVCVVQLHSLCATEIHALPCDVPLPPILCVCLCSNTLTALRCHSMPF